MLFMVLHLSAQDSLKIMSYNLRFGQLSSMDSIARFISSENPDLVALQECDWATYRESAPGENGVKFINVLAYETGMFGLYGKTIDYEKGYYGIGILSKYPVVSCERKLLPNSGVENEPRAMLLCKVELPDGDMVTFVCTHLDVDSPELRGKQLEFINREVKRIKTPVILAGDMNAVPESSEIRKGLKGWKHLTDNSMMTFSSTDPHIKIDYIVGRPAGRISLVSTEVCYHVFLSDHFPVISTIRLNINK